MCRRHPHISQTEATAAFGKARLSRIKQLRRMCLVLVIDTSPSFTLTDVSSSSHFPDGSHGSILAKHASLVSNNYAACSGKHNNTSRFNQGNRSQQPNPNTNQHSIYLLTFSLTRLSLGGGQSRNNGPGCTAATKQQFTMMMLWR